jgi:hypothetical protein
MVALLPWFLYRGVRCAAVETDAWAAREALRKSLDVIEEVYVEQRRGEVGDG